MSRVEPAPGSRCIFARRGPPVKVLVTGAAGMLGRDVMLAAGNAGHDVVGFGHAELDVTDGAGGREEAGPRASRRCHQLRGLDRR